MTRDTNDNAKRNRLPTIGDGQPSVLLLDLKVQTSALCSFLFAIHMVLLFAGLSALFDIGFLWWGGRHDVVEDSRSGRIGRREVVWLVGTTSHTGAALMQRRRMPNAGLRHSTAQRQVRRSPSLALFVPKMIPMFPLGKLPRADGVMGWQMRCLFLAGGERVRRVALNGRGGM